MSSKKERKLKRLRKKRIWPSVVMFVLSFMVSVLVVFTFLTMFIVNIIHSKFSDSNTRSNHLTESAQVLYENGYSWEQVVGFIKTMGIADSVAVVDGDFNAVASYGELCYVVDAKQVQDFSNRVNDIYSVTGAIQPPSRLFLPDNSETELLSDGYGSYDSIIQGITRAALDFSFTENESDNWFDEQIYTLSFWVCSPIGDSGFSLVNREAIAVRRVEVFFIVSACILAICLLCIPMLVFLINVVMNIVSQRNLRELLFTDSITGGKSWFYIENNAKALISGRGLLARLGLESADTRAVAVVDFSLQKYRSYCTCHGAEAGELLLENIDRQINKMIYRREACARVSKADFALILRGRDAEEIKTRVSEMTAKVAAAVGVHHLIWHAGIYMADRSSTDIKQMLNFAGAARATLNGTDSTDVVVFDQKLLDQQIWEHKVEERMEKALENEEFEVYLQPKYNPVDEHLSGAEALIRWISPEDGFISPGRFIPIFEKNGFITKIDDYMISHTAAQQAKWIAEGKPVVPVSVNISRAHFTQPDLAEHIRALVDRYNVPHEVIEIELTESAFFDDKAALLSTVNRLKEYGFDISMDDFGAGYSSLNSLKDLPLDVLKLDAEFFRGNAEKERSETVVSEAIRLAKSLNMRIVAEGIEKKEQVDFLAGQGCDMIQGYYFAKPMPIGDFEKKHWG